LKETLHRPFLLRKAIREGGITLYETASTPAFVKVPDPWNVVVNKKNSVTRRVEIAQLADG